MKIRTMSFGVVLLSVVILLSGIAMNRDSYKLRTVCEANPVQCITPHNVSPFRMLP